jgi:hypothetical protein
MEKKPFRRPGCRKKSNIVMDFCEIGSEDVDIIGLVLRASVRLCLAAMNMRIPLNFIAATNTYINILLGLLKNENT